MYKQSPKSPAMKALVGNQPNLSKGLRDAIEAAPAPLQTNVVSLISLLVKCRALIIPAAVTIAVPC